MNYHEKPLKIFLHYIAGHKGLFAIDMVCALLVAAIDLVFPFVSRRSMSALLPQRLYTAFFVVMAVLIVSFVLKAALYYVITVLGHRMGVLTEADMRRDLFAHMQKLSFSFFDRNRTGVLLARVTNDLFEIVELAHHGPENILTCSVTILGALIVLCTINVPLTLVLVVVLPVCLSFSMYERKRMQDTQIDVKNKTGQINAAIESGISGIRTSKAFANEDAEQEKFAAANEAFKASKVGFYRAMGAFNAGVEATVGFMQVAVVTVGGLLIMRGKMDYVDLLTFTLYVSTFTSPVRKLAQFMEIFSQGTAGFGRFLELMRTKPEIQDAPDAADLEQAKGRICFKDVSFSYSDGTEVLENINLDIRPGETVALVGSSGGGKTTMCHLIPRFYDVTKGAVTIDGQDVRKLTQESLRKNIGIIQQDVFLFAGTVLDNIRYGRPDATPAEIAEAAKLADIHEDIMAMPDGYHTMVGERGIMLSGGQKQRISIARVFLKNPPILILDEATSALDSVTEQIIQESLDKLSRGKTCIVIAHRLSTVRGADRIAVIDDRHIIEQGSREELLRLNGAYAALEQAQELR